MEKTIEINGVNVPVKDQYNCLECGCKHFRLLRVDGLCSYWINQCVECGHVIDGAEVKFL